MVIEEVPEWLPPGWIGEAKERSDGEMDYYYVNLKTGEKCRSKIEVADHTKSENLCDHMPQKIKRCKRDDENQVVQMEDVPKWLPTDWTMVVKTRKSGNRVGQKYKCFIAPITGFRLYSKRGVFHYLKTGKLRSRASEVDECDIGMDSTKSARKVVVEKHKAEGLPPGWIKEIKVTQLADRTRKDMYYIESVTGYVFCSKKDVFRYLESGDVGKCASRPRKRQISEMDITDGEIFAQTSALYPGTTLVGDATTSMGTSKSSPVATPTPAPGITSTASEAGASCTHRVPPINVSLPAFPGWTYWKLGKEAPIPQANTVHGVPCGYDYVPAHRYEDLVKMVTSLKEMVSGLTEENARLRSNAKGYQEANDGLHKVLGMRLAAATTTTTTPWVTPIAEATVTVSRTFTPASSRPISPTPTALQVVRPATVTSVAVPGPVASTAQALAAPQLVRPANATPVAVPRPVAPAAQASVATRVLRSATAALISVPRPVYSYGSSSDDDGDDKSDDKEDSEEEWSE